MGGRLGAALLITSAVMSACGMRDPGASAITITAPGAMAGAATPLTVRWRSSITPSGGFAVFVDRAPMRPGRDLRSIVRRENDKACLQRPACPDATWLGARGIYVVDGRAVTIPTVEVPADGKGGGVHKVSVVALGRSARRTDDAGATVEFVLRAAGD
jgi:hypothetical protein